MSARGGAENDVFDATILPSLVSGGRVNLVFDGENGQDRLAAHIQPGAESAGTFSLKILGGGGQDDLTLSLSSIPQTVTLTDLLDGGPGKDVAHITRGVRVVNCEITVFGGDPH